MSHRLPAYLLLLAIVTATIPACERSEDSASVVLRRGNGGDPETLDPARAEDIHAFRVLTDLYEGLVTIDASGNVIAGVAESWEVSSDGLTYAFLLRPDAVWSNGERVTADHFLAGFRRTLAPKAASAYGFLLHAIRNASQVSQGELPLSALGIRAPDRDTLIIELASPAPYFLSVLTMPIAFPAWPAEIADESRFANPDMFVGNGPFVLDDWQPGHRISLRKNKRFREANSVRIDMVEYYAINDLLTELNMYRAGELDITASVPGANVEKLRANRPSELRIAPRLAIYYLAFDLSEAPLDDLALRQALSMAIDRTALTQVIGRGEQPAFGLVPDGVRGYTPSRYAWETLTNPERQEQARRMYANSPHSANDALRLKLSYDTGDIHERIALAVSSMWRDVLGIDVELDKREWKYFLETRGKRDEWQIMRFAWTGDYDHASTFTDILLSTSPQNLPGYASSRFDSLIAAATAEQDVDVQARLLASAESTMLDDYPIAPLYFYVSKHLVGPGVRGFDDNVLDQHPSRYLRLESNSTSP